MEPPAAHCNLADAGAVAASYAGQDPPHLQKVAPADVAAAR